MNNIDIQYCFAVAIAQVIYSDASEKIKELRIEGLKQLCPIIMQYQNDGFLDCIVEEICKKKVEFLLEAKSKTAVKDIIKLSVPRYDGNRFYAGSPYHVEAEEMLLWSQTSLLAPLIPKAMKRYEELFHKWFGYAI